MTWKKSLSLTVGAVLAVVIGVVIIAAMVAADQHEEMVHLYKDVQALQQNGKNKNNPKAVGNGGPMELRGQWSGMSVAAARMTQGQPAGENEQGLTVVNIDPQNGERARRAGVVPGDVIVGVDQKPVRSLTDLDGVARGVNPEQPVLLDVQRGGAIVTLVMPPEAPMQNQPVVGPGPNLYCPTDGILVPVAAAGPNQTCPRCGNPLHMYTPPMIGAAP